MAEKPPYFRLSFFYLSYFAALGAFVPYWSVYLKHNHFDSIAIGQLMGLFMFSKLLAPLIWGWITDHSGSRLKWIRIAAFLTIFGLLPVLYQSGYWWMAVAMLLFGFFWNASLPQFEALTLNYLGSYTSRYSWIRLWGSIGFIAMVAGLPFVFKYQGVNSLPGVLLLLFIVTWLATFVISEKQQIHVPAFSSGKIITVIRHPMVIALFVACILQTASHGTYYTFFSIYLEELGYSRVFTGWMWALGVVAEVVLFLFIYKLADHFKTYQLFQFALFLTCLRWVLLATLADHLNILLVSQILHAASYGLFHISAIQLIHDWFPGRMQGRGQALYAGLSFGLGGALGSIISGYLWQYSGAAMSFLIMAVMAGLAWLAAILFIRKSELWKV